MKIVAQLVSYLWTRGRLSPPQLAYLRAQGYYRLPADALPDDPAHASAVPSPAGSGQVVTGTSGQGLDLDLDSADELERACGRRRSATRRRARAAAQRERQACARATLAAHLSTLTPTWEPALVGLVCLARRLAPAATWAEAARELRNASPLALQAALAEGLASRQPTLPLLWDALSFDGYRDSTLLSPAARQLYAAWLDVAARGASGGTVRLPRSREVAAVGNLVQAQRRVVVACGRLYDERPDLLAEALRRDQHAGAYLAFVLVHTAREEQQASRPARSDEHYPRRPLPDAAGWPRAWEQALLLDPRCVGPLYRAWMGLAAPAAVHGSAQRLRLVCPAAWDRGYLPAWAAFDVEAC